MKIMLISQPLDRVLPPSQNSIGIWIYEVARRLARHHEVHVCVNGGLLPPKSRPIDGVSYHFVRTLPFRHTQELQSYLSRYKSPRKPFFSSWLFYFEYALKAALDARRYQVDLVHIVNFSQFVPIVRALNPRTGIILHMQCEWLSQLDPQMIESRLKATNFIIGCSEYITQKVRARFPEFARNCGTVFNGVDETTFVPNPTPAGGGPVKLLFVSRLSPEKGVHVLLRAFQLVNRQHPDTELHLVGSLGSAPPEFIIKMTGDSLVAQLSQFYTGGEYTDHLRKEIPAGLKDKVIFHGHQSRRLISQYFKSANILINPSISEPFGMALVEGMASGLPVIASSVGGMVEIVQNNVTGLIVKPNDAHDLAKAILSLLENPSIQTQLGKAGRQRVLETFTWDRIVDSLLLKYMKVFSEVAEPLPAETTL